MTYRTQRLRNYGPIASIDGPHDVTIMLFAMIGLSSAWTLALATWLLW